MGLGRGVRGQQLLLPIKAAVVMDGDWIVPAPGPLLPPPGRGVKVVVAGCTPAYHSVRNASEQSLEIRTGRPRGWGGARGAGAHQPPPWSWLLSRGWAGGGGATRKSKRDTGAWLAGTGPRPVQRADWPFLWVQSHLNSPKKLVLGPLCLEKPETGAGAWNAQNTQGETPLTLSCEGRGGSPPLLVTGQLPIAKHSKAPGVLCG